MLIKCPNCNRDTFDDYKCQYCKYVIKPKENNFEKEIYEYLKADYLNTKNKAATIKNGMNKYNKPMKEIKEIVDYIADEVYEAENYSSKEELEPMNIVELKHSNSHGLKFVRVISLILLALSAACLVLSATKYENKTFLTVSFCAFIALICVAVFSWRPEKVKEKNTFYHSYIQYFVHDMIYRILILGALCYIPIYFKEVFFKDEYILLIWAWYFVWLLLLLYSLTKWASAIDSAVAIYPEKISYRYRKPNRVSNKRDVYFFSDIYVNYDIMSINKVTETFNSIIIYGDIVKEQFCMLPGNRYKRFTPKKYKKIIIRKGFKNNKALVSYLKSKVKQ